MTDLDSMTRPSATERTQRVLDPRYFRHELQQQRAFRLDQLTRLTYDAEAATEALAEVNATLRRGARAVLAQIDAALFRLAVGSFGICQRCADTISTDRLHAVPMASLCLRCACADRTHEAPEDRPPAEPDIVDLWGLGSFPASDPPANW